MEPTRIRRCHGHDGTELHVEEYGSGAPIVLCNGVVCTIGPYWQFLIRHLATLGRVIAWDYRGHGRSGVPRDLEACAIEDHVRDLGCVLDATGVEDAVLIGHSMGCQVILEAYRQFPERIRGLVPICGTYGRPYRTFYGKDFLEPFYDPMLREVRRHHELVRQIADVVKRTPIPQLVARAGAVHWYLAPWSSMDAYFEHVFSMNTEFLLTVVRRMGEHSAEDLLPHVDVPTLIVAGAKDPFTPPSVAWEMHRQIPGAEILVIPNGTHVAQLEHPDLVGLRIEKFVSDHGLLSRRGRSSGASARERANGRERAAPRRRSRATRPAGEDGRERAPARRRRAARGARVSSRLA